MKLKRLMKRITAFSLAVLMTVVAFPYDSVVHAGPDDYPPEILFPIEVYDFRADNLLFEWFTNWQAPNVDLADYDIYFDLYGGAENADGKGLIENTLDPNTGLPVYKKATVERIAKYLQKALEEFNDLDAPNSTLVNPMVDGQVNYTSMLNYIHAGKWTTIEAEDGVLSNGAAIQGGNRVNNIGDDDDGTVALSYYSQQAGMRTIRLYYATNANRTFSVVINEGTTNRQEYVVNCPDNDSWDNIGAVPVAVDVAMIQGNNTITISGDNGNESPNLGHIEVDNSYTIEPTANNTFVFEWKSTGDYYMEIDSADNNATYACTVNGANVGNISEAGNLLIPLNGFVLDENTKRNTIQNTIQFTGNSNVERIRIYNNGYPLGTYDSSKAYFDEDMDPNTANVVENTRGWTDITTCMDYAYFITSNLFRSNASVNTVVDDYDYLVFHKIEDEDENGANGKTAYEFMADQNHENADLIYNKNQKTVRNVAMFEAEDGELANGAAVNGTKVGNIGGEDNGTATFVYESTQAGEHAIRLHYASNQNRRFNVTVINSLTGANGVTVTTNNLNNVSWTNFTPVDVPMNLVQGENTIIISGVDGAWAPDLDYIEIIKEIEGDEVRDGGSLFLADDLEKNDFNGMDRNYNGEDNQSHNFHYTVKSESKFVYKQGAGQYFYFSGDDDVYVFVNGKLLVDLGGAHQQIDDDFNLDALSLVDENNDGVNDYGLVDGEVVSLSFFYMERHTVASNFYAKLNFKLATDELEHVFDYEVIPYGHLANLTYSFTAMRELNTNKNFTFTDNFGNVFGSGNADLDGDGQPDGVGFRLGEGVSLLNNTLVVTVKDVNGNVDATRSRQFVFENPDNPTSANDLKTIEDMKAYFESLAIKQNEELEVSGAQYDTATVPYETYEDTGTIGERLVTFTPALTYDALMEDVGAQISTTNALTVSNPVKVIVGTITIATSKDVDNEKTELADYGEFELVRTYTDDAGNELSQSKICYTNDTTAYGVSEITIDELVLGDYTLSVDESVLTGYTVIINGVAVTTSTDADGKEVETTQNYTTMETDGTNKKMLTIPLRPVYDAKTQKWSYPDVRFEVKATRDLPSLSDLT